MADYYAILKKALGALPDSTGEARRAVYEKARRALVAQLKSVDPPLPPSEITKQRLALEESIRKVESEAARESLAVARGQAPAAGKPTTAASTAPSKADSAAAGKPSAQPAAGAGAAAGGQTPKPVEPRQPLRPASPSGTGAAGGSSHAQEFRQAVADADSLGTATSEASRTARKVLDAAETDIQEDAGRQEPVLAAEEAAGGVATEVTEADVPPLAGDEPTDPEVYEDDTYQGQVPQPLSPRVMWLAAAAIIAVILLGVGGWIYSQRDMLFGDDVAQETTPTPVVTTPEETAKTPAADDGLTPKITDRLPSANGNGAAPDARSVKTMRVVAPTSGESPEAGDPTPSDSEEPRVIPADDNGAGNAPADPEATPDQSSSSEPDQSSDAAVNQAPVAAATDSEPEAGNDTQVASAPAEQPSPSSKKKTVLVGQRAILYEEADESGADRRYQGGVTWTLTEEPVDGGEKTDTVLIAHVDIPERNVALDVKIRPNRDKSIPASYWIEVGFSLPDDFSGEGIANVPGLIMKTTEAARGDALTGASARVLDDLFWIALSQIEVESERNEKLLKERGWIDIPVMYKSNKRAIFTLEKGNPGDQLIEEAFAKWSAG